MPIKQSSPLDFLRNKNPNNPINRIRKIRSILQSRLNRNIEAGDLGEIADTADVIGDIAMIAQEYPSVNMIDWTTDHTAIMVARALGYYLGDGSYSGLELDAIAMDGGAIADLVLAAFSDTDDIDVDPARAAIHIRSDGSIVVTQGHFVVNGLMNFDNGSAAIAGGVITATRSFMTIDTQGGAATDDLDTINGGVEGDLLILSTTVSTRDVTVKDLTGNIQCAGDFIMNTAADTITLIKSGGNWREVSRSSNA